MLRISFKQRLRDVSRFAKDRKGIDARCKLHGSWSRCVQHEEQSKESYFSLLYEAVQGRWRKGLRKGLEDVMRVVSQGDRPQMQEALRVVHDAVG